jgi:hypothetical protein
MSALGQQRVEVGKLGPLSDIGGELEEGASSVRTALAVTAVVAAMMRMRQIHSNWRC